MGLPSLKYNDNEQEHRGFADTLGSAQGLFLAGKLTRDTSHAYYGGHELKDQGEVWDRGAYHLKRDCPGAGKTAMGRSQNRVIVRIGSDGKLVENWAVAWRHDNRLLQLDAGFFKRAEGMKNLYMKA